MNRTVCGKAFTLLAAGLLFLNSQVPPAQAELCGMAGSNASIPGDKFAGYWQTTFGLLRLVQFGPSWVEGPGSASGYIRGTQTGPLLQGRLGEDPGQLYGANVQLQMTEGGRCLKGTYVFDGDKEVNEILGFRIQRPTQPYRFYYELTDRTEQLKRLTGGILDLDTIDGQDFRAFPAGFVPSAIPTTAPATIMPSAGQQESDDPDAHEDNHQRPEGYD
ncbi:hypothetical protein [Vampirovibrio chlorellavorus]|uniref:hypothetical protein n=1 Tax=Vampirovibrio chlorellavorus TaxID=758823 RepID=UPI0026EE8A80|nr:hypothetical protein [Vampirovibrio chlorellavorus]